MGYSWTKKDCLGMAQVIQDSLGNNSAFYSVAERAEILYEREGRDVMFPKVTAVAEIKGLYVERQQVLEAPTIGDLLPYVNSPDSWIRGILRWRFQEGR